MRQGYRHTKRYPRYRVTAGYITDDRSVTAVMSERLMAWKEISDMMNFMNPILAEGWLNSIRQTRECVITMVDSIDNGKLIKVYKFIRN